jgi:hypothetical protein
VKDYEEVKLKEMYSMILEDSGIAHNFDKKFVAKPIGYSLNHLMNSNAKLNTRNKRMISGTSIHNISGFHDNS